MTEPWEESMPTRQAGGVWAMVMLRRYFSAAVAAALLTVLTGPFGSASAEIKAGDAAVQARVNEAYGKLPISFEVNRGQTDARVDFLSRGSGYSLFLTSTAAV